MDTLGIHPLSFLHRDVVLFLEVVLYRVLKKVVLCWRFALFQGALLSIRGFHCILILGYHYVVVYRQGQ